MGIAVGAAIQREKKLMWLQGLVQGPASELGQTQAQIKLGENELRAFVRRKIWDCW